MSRAIFTDAPAEMPTRRFRPRNRSVKSLFYCQEEVEAQFAEWLESRRGASATPAEEGVTDTEEGRAAADDKGETGEDGRGLPFPRAVIAAHLAESRAALARAREVRREGAGEDALCEALARAAARLEELAADFGRAARPDAELLEASLADLEALLERARAVSGTLTVEPGPLQDAVDALFAGADVAA